MEKLNRLFLFHHTLKINHWKNSSAVEDSVGRQMPITPVFSGCVKIQIICFCLFMNFVLENKLNHFKRVHGNCKSTRGNSELVHREGSWFWFRESLKLPLLLNLPLFRGFLSRLTCEADAADLISSHSFTNNTHKHF